MAVPLEDAKPKEEEEEELRAPYRDLYRYATCVDKIMLVVAVICSLAAGVALPGMLVFFGDSITALAADPLSVNTQVMNFIYVGIGAGVTAFFGRYVKPRRPRQPQRTRTGIMMEYPWHAPGGTGCEGGRGREGAILETPSIGCSSSWLRRSRQFRPRREADNKIQEFVCFMFLRLCF